MFRLLAKLDFAFSSLLQGRDVDTGEPLPGFEGGRRLSGTEKVRIKGLVERTRVCVVGVMNSGEFDREDVEGESSRSGDDSMAEQNAVEDEPDGGEWDMEVARVYDRTIVELGDTLGGSPIGIVID